MLRKSRPPPQQQKILLHDVACALSQLHSMGLVQMDIRPANVMFFGCALRRVGACRGQEAAADLLAKPKAWVLRRLLPWPRSRPSHSIPIHFHPTRSKEGAWKLVDFENWAWAGQPADVSYALRYAAPEVRSRGLVCEQAPCRPGCW